ncbi:sugar kinase [bacterium]|nr:sugar kinase [bacterium]
MDIISLGECMVEMFCEGRFLDASTFTRSYGGDTLNTLVAAARLGASAGFITRVGNDPFADLLMNSWASEGIDLSQVHRVPGFNGIYFISLLERGETEFTYYRPGSAASKLAKDDLSQRYIAGANIIHTSGITQAISATASDTALHAFRTARAAGVVTSFDPNLRLKLTTLEKARNDLMAILPHTDVFLPSHSQEAELLFQGMSPDGIIHFASAMGVKHIVIKCGQDGCIVGSEGEVRRMRPWFDVDVVDTTGAGDAFNGGFLFGISRGLSAFEAARIGLATASLKVAGRGAILSLPKREDVIEVVGDLP